MKIVNEVHRKLGRFVDSLRAEERTLASIFKKTRFNSHIDFIRTCLGEKLIPSGFVVSRDVGHFSPWFKKRMEKA